MLRIHLTPADLTRVSFAPVPGLELGASALTLFRPTGRPGTDRWRRWTLSRLPHPARPLLDLVADAQRIPRVLLGGCVPDPATTPARLVTACRVFEAEFLAPIREPLRTSVDAELARLGRLLLAEGVGAALTGLGPGIGFDGRTLTVTDSVSGTDVDIELGGRGLKLIPTYFWRRCGYSDEGVERPVLVYPIARPHTPLRSAEDAMALERLLGRNRARVLRATLAGGGTGELARSIGISAASASEHLGVLRDAGFVVTSRVGRSVRHELTPLGVAALRFD